MTQQPTKALQERTVLLTGVTGDIGSAYLHALTAAGANVVATDLTHKLCALVIAASQEPPITSADVSVMSCDGTTLKRPGVGPAFSLDPADLRSAKSQVHDQIGRHVHGH